MEKIALPAPLQKSLLECYIKTKNIDWLQAAKEFEVGYSTLRCSYRTGRLSLPLKILYMIVLDTDELQKILDRYKTYSVADSVRIPKTNPQKARATLIKKYGRNIFSKLGQKGAAVTNKLWTEERRIKQSEAGRCGGIKRIANATFLTEQEKILAEENKKLNLDFKTNYFLSADMNFDFVYFKNNKPLAVEEATSNPFRGFAYFIEKRKFLDKKFGEDFPFLLTIKDVGNVSHLIDILNESRIIVANTLEDRNKVLNTNFSFKPKINIKHISTKAAENELKRPFSIYEKQVDLALRRLKLKPEGKRLLRKGQLSLVTDNSFVYLGKKMNVLVAYAKSRGSLFYQLYKNATYGHLIRNVFGEKVFVIIFDFSKTASSKSNNIPRKLCLQNCDFYAVTFKSDAESLKLALKDVLGQ